MSTDTQVRRGPRYDLIRRPRLRGADRDRVRTQIATAYREDPTTSIRSLAAEHGMAFGLTRTLLIEAGVQFRSRIRRPKAAGQ